MHTKFNFLNFSSIFLTPPVTIFRLIQCAAFLGLLLLAAPAALSGKSKVIWQIGQTDRNTSEFALAPSDHRKLQQDGFFLVGVSDPAREWPYVQPGPGDAWAGARPHTYTVIFGLKSAGTRDSCRLVIDLADTHSSIPPQLEIRVNDLLYRMDMPAGGGDASIDGSPEKGKPHQISLSFPASALKTENTLSITSTSGSWILYDALKLEGPDYLAGRPVKSHLSISGLFASQGLYDQDGRPCRDITMTVRYAGKPFHGQLTIGGKPVQAIDIIPGSQVLTLTVPEVTAPATMAIGISKEGQALIHRDLPLKPVRQMTIYILPHSHTDIGYTEIQTAIEDKQVQNLVDGIRIARQTASYPPGARFIWNVEVGWAADLYLSRLGEEARQEFFQAAKSGQIAFNGMYLNELTGLCRPEELLRLFKYSTQLASQTGQKIDAAMISDVPGYTWGTVTAMAQAGIRYFSVAPNYFDRIGDILVQWENRPFWWVSPSGEEKVLVWIPLKGYALSHTINNLTPEWVSDYMGQLDKMEYPYDISHIRWSGHGDNAVPDPTICEFVREWNARHTWPRFIISSTSEAFTAFEKKYGDRIPSAAGDWTPYWEDGAGSSALETGMNRNTADRLSQTQTLWALQRAESYPASRFEEAWKKVLLYSEHTWGAWCSITDPENAMTIEQWAIKKGYAGQAVSLTAELMRRMAAPAAGNQAEVVNTTSWPRNEMIFLTKEQSTAGDRVTDAAGRTLMTQRLASGELAVLGARVEPFSALRLTVRPGKRTAEGSVVVSGSKIQNNRIACEIDPVTGDIVSLTDVANGRNLVDRTGDRAVNQYLYFAGNRVEDVQTSGNARLVIKENGPLLGCIEITSAAPGCHSLTRQIWLAHDADYLVISNTVDKKRAPMPDKIGDWFLAQNRNKESVNFCFPFAVPGGTMTMDLPIGHMVPQKDQIPSACKNWFTAGRWVDVSNNQEGVTWVTLDAPLVEVGYLSANLVGSQTNPDVWRKTVEPTQTFYSWAMNNHWGTNYRQYQEGPVQFRYVMRPHSGFDPAAATRFATGFSQPLIVRKAAEEPAIAPFTLKSQSVMVIAFKPADDGRGYVVTLYNPSFLKESFALTPASGSKLYRCDTGENVLEEAPAGQELGGRGIVTLRFD